MKKSTTVKIMSAVVLGAGLAGFCLTSGPCQAKSKANTARPTTQKSAVKEIRWLTSLSTALNESRQSGKPIFVDFYADWCPPCQMMKKQTFPNPQVIAESQKWVMLKINVDQQPDLAAKYRISSLPTLAVLNFRGEPVTGIMGFASAADLLKMMRDTYETATLNAGEAQ